MGISRLVGCVGIVGAMAACGGGGGGTSPNSPSASFALLSPTGGETWIIGSTVTVTWQPGSYVGLLDIDLSLDGGTTWILLQQSTPNDGSEAIVVPDLTTSTARLQIGAADGVPATPAAPSSRASTDFVISGSFPRIGSTLAGASHGAVAWGDYDEDGDMDLAVVGLGAGPDSFIAQVYENDGGVFTVASVSLEGVGGGALAWGDYDNDGDLDLAIAGLTKSSGMQTTIYRNDRSWIGSNFVPAVSLTGVHDGALAWGDYDNDGDLDLVVSGTTGALALTTLYRNDGGVFTDAGAGLLAVYRSAVAWGDYDGDGDLDLALSGFDFTPVARIYRNDGGVFVNIVANIRGNYTGSLAWADFDGDGDLDLALAGDTGFSAFRSAVYRNDKGIFHDIAAPLIGARRCSLAWGDYDGDGDPDLAIAGETASGPQTVIYRNDGVDLISIGAGIDGVAYASIAWGDCDGDGDLDLAVAGDSTTGPVCRIHRNLVGLPNTRPTAPTGVSTVSGGWQVLVRWDFPSDVETLVTGLSYNLRVGQTPFDDQDYPSMARIDGERLVPALGPFATTASFGEAWLNLPSGVYVVSVQAVDASFRAGPWSDPVPFAVP